MLFLSDTYRYVMEIFDDVDDMAWYTSVYQRTYSKYYWRPRSYEIKSS